jgi:hypothetical protein
LRLAHATVTKQEDLDLRVVLLAGLKVLVVCADFIHDVLPIMFAADFRREIVKLATSKIEYLQPRQQRFQMAKLPNAFATMKVELLESSECGQRGKVAESMATGNVEPLKRGEINERCKIAELFAPGEVEILELGKFGQWRNVTDSVAHRETELPE